MESKEAVEVLHSEKVLYLEKIKETESRFNGMPTDIKEMYEKSNKVYKEFIDALDEALLALEKLDRLEKWLDKQETKEEQEKQNYNKVYLGVRLNFLKEVRATLNHCGDLTEPRAKHSEVLL